MPNVDDLDLQRLSLTRAVDRMPECTLTFADRDGAYDPQLTTNWLPDETPVHVELGWSGGLADAFRGLVGDHNPSSDPVSMGASVDVVLYSPFRRWENRPVNTEEFTSARGRDIMLALATDYGATDAALVDTPLEDNTTTISKVILHEKSIAQALRRVAEACRVEIFTGATGKLTTSAYHAETDAIALTIQESDLRGGAAVAGGQSNEDGVSRVRVRGRWKTAADDGEQVLYDRVLSYNSDAIRTYWDIWVSATREISGKPSVSITWQAPDPPFVVETEIRQIGRKRVRIVLRRTDGILSDCSFRLVVTAKLHPPREATVLSERVQGAYRTAQENDPTRIDEVVQDDDRFAKYGATEVLIDNPAVSSASGAQAIAQYWLDLSRWRQNQFTIPITYVAGLDLNQVIRFPYRGRWLKGLVREIRTEYESGQENTGPTLFQTVVAYRMGTAEAP